MLATVPVRLVSVMERTPIRGQDCLAPQPLALDRVSLGPGPEILLVLRSGAAAGSQSTCHLHGDSLDCVARRNGERLVLAEQGAAVTAFHEVRHLHGESPEVGDRHHRIRAERGLFDESGSRPASSATSRGDVGVGASAGDGVGGVFDDEGDPAPGLVDAHLEFTGGHLGRVHRAQRGGLLGDFQAASEQHEAGGRQTRTCHVNVPHWRKNATDLHRNQ